MMLKPYKSTDWTDSSVNRYHYLMIMYQSCSQIWLLSIVKMHGDAVITIVCNKYLIAVCDCYIVGIL